MKSSNRIYSKKDMPTITANDVLQTTAW